MNRNLTPLQTETSKLFDAAQEANDRLSPPLWGRQHERKTYRVVCEHFAEDEFIDTISTLGLDYDSLDGTSYTHNIMRSLEHFIARGRYREVFEALYAKKPSLDWPDTFPEDQNKHFSEEALREFSVPVQYCNLLHQHFVDVGEREPIINTLNLNLSTSDGYGYHINRMQLCACIVIYAQQTGQTQALLDTIKKERPHVEAIQNLPQLEESNAFVGIDIYELIRAFTEVTYAPFPLEYEPLATQLERSFSAFDWEVMLADLGWSPGKYLMSSSSATIRLLLREIPENMMAFSQLLSWCQIRQSEIDWFSLANVERYLAIQPDTLFRDGAKSIAIRKLMAAAWQDNDAIFTFCEMYFPWSRLELSLQNAPNSNRFYLFSVIERRGHLANFLKLLKNEYPEEYVKFGPYV